MDLIFDDAQLASVARVILRYNRYVLGSSVENIVGHMKMVARQTFTGPTAAYVGTSGYTLSLYLQYGDAAAAQYGVYASVASHLFEADGSVPVTNAIEAV